MQFSQLYEKAITPFTCIYCKDVFTSASSFGQLGCFHHEKPLKGVKGRTPENCQRWECCLKEADDPGCVETDHSPFEITGNACCITVPQSYFFYESNPAGFLKEPVEAAFKERRIGTDGIPRIEIVRKVAQSKKDTTI